MTTTSYPTMPQPLPTSIPTFQDHLPLTLFLNSEQRKAVPPLTMSLRQQRTPTKRLINEPLTPSPTPSPNKTRPRKPSWTWAAPTPFQNIFGEVSGRRSSFSQMRPILSPKTQEEKKADSIEDKDGDKAMDSEDEDGEVVVKGVKKEKGYRVEKKREGKTKKIILRVRNNSVGSLPEMEGLLATTAVRRGSTAEGANDNDKDIDDAEEADEDDDMDEDPSYVSSSEESIDKELRDRRKSEQRELKGKKVVRFRDTPEVRVFENQTSPASPSAAPYDPPTPRPPVDSPSLSPSSPSDPREKSPAPSPPEVPELNPLTSPSPLISGPSLSPQAVLSPPTLTSSTGTSSSDASTSTIAPAPTEEEPVEKAVTAAPIAPAPKEEELDEQAQILANFRRNRDMGELTIEQRRIAERVPTPERTEERGTVEELFDLYDEVALTRSLADWDAQNFGGW
ncbi:hypothetical protein DFH27DRAFT_645017 [Peziza echinospora]|nr:hypothetical protein DFH27DRAFT_645017 [Peziza echinospora]